MSNELPGDWGKRLGPKGIHSYRDMAAAVGGGVSQGTMQRLVVGKATSAATVNKVADALFDGDRDLVWRLRGSSRKDHGDWSLPADASLLTEEQRKAVLAVIRAMIPDEREEGDSSGGTAGANPDVIYRDHDVQLRGDAAKVTETLEKYLDQAGGDAYAAYRMLLNARPEPDLSPLEWREAVNELARRGAQDASDPATPLAQVGHDPKVSRTSERYQKGSTESGESMAQVRGNRPPPAQTMPEAARPPGASESGAKSAEQINREQQDQAGEESQDPGGTDPA